MRTAKYQVAIFEPHVDRLVKALQRDQQHDLVEYLLAQIHMQKALKELELCNKQVDIMTENYEKQLGLN